MRRGRSKKIEEAPIKIEKVKDESKEEIQTMNVFDLTHCAYCKRDLGERGGTCAKGEYNEIKFCSIKCFNLHDRIDEFHYKP